MPTSNRLLQARSYNAPAVLGSYEVVPPAPYRTPPLPHSQDDIRKSTMELSKVPFSPPTSPGRQSPSNTTRPDFIFPIVDDPPPPTSSFSSSMTSLEEEEGDDLTQSQVTFASVAPSPSSSPSLSSRASSHVSPPHTPRTAPLRPSGLSLLRQEYESGADPNSDGARTPTAIQHSPDLSTAVPQQQQPPPWSDKPQPSELESASVSGRTSASSPTGVRVHPLASLGQSLPISSRTHSADRPRSGLEASTPTAVSNMPNTRLWPFSSDVEPMSHFGSPASLMPHSETTPLLRSGTPRPTQNGFGGSPPSQGTFDFQQRHDSNQPPRYTPSPSPQLELGVEPSAPPRKPQGVGTRLRLLVDQIPYMMRLAMESIPAVLLGCLLNVLDSVSCGYYPPLFQFFFSLSFLFGKKLF